MEKSIGMFRGKFFEKMTREELLEFAAWADNEFERLNPIARDTQEYRIRQELAQKGTRK